MFSLQLPDVLHAVAATIHARGLVDDACSALHAAVTVASALAASVGPPSPSSCEMSLSLTPLPILVRNVLEPECLPVADGRSNHSPTPSSQRWKLLCGLSRPRRFRRRCPRRGAGCPRPRRHTPPPVCGWSELCVMAARCVYVFACLCVCWGGGGDAGLGHVFGLGMFSFNLLLTAGLQVLLWGDQRAGVSDAQRPVR